jgi:hypothetical protein
VSVLRPLGIAGAVTLFVLVGVWLVPGLIDSIEQRTLHRSAIHSDNSTVQTGTVPSIKRPITLVYRDLNGTLHRLLADETETNRFVNDTLLYLDAERSRIKAETEKEIGAVLDEGFSDRKDAISRYADWYFAWSRPWAFLKEAVTGGIKGIGINNIQGITEASRNEVEAYLLRNYQRFVLQPELRNPIIEAGVSRVLANAHSRYLTVLTTIDVRTQIFLNEFTHHLEVIDPRDKAGVSLDWDAQKWKAPRYAIDDEAFESVLRGTQFVALSGLIAATIGTTAERALAEVFGAAATRIAGIIRPQMIGFTAGSVIEPGGGSLAGWLAGAAGGIALDYVYSVRRERLGRSDFENATAEALSTTIGEWGRVIQRDLFRAIDAWFDDTRAIVAEHKIHRS